MTQSYWAHGAPSQLSNLAGLPAISYGGTIGSTAGLDGEGRITQVTAGSGQTPITGVTYNNASLPTQVSFGSGDNDIFAYDSNTLRMTQFKFNVGTQSQYFNGALTWNANSTLNQLAITDQFNTPDTQTCNYSHDDLTRIATANCGTAANQTFSYDPFGNISKSGSPYSFQPTYSAATNRFATIPGTTPSYDADGNVLSDGNHTYTWDANGRAATVDSVNLTFDALGRMAEQARGTTYTQVVHAPTGERLALLNGQTLQKAFVPLPGNATAIYTNSGLDHYRHSDWLGSTRLTSSPSRAYISGVAYAPFGETYASSGTTDPSFTGQNPDTASTDYDFLFRGYSAEGRWPSPDPAGLSAVDPTLPQSWNRYAYVLNNPLLLIDPLGLCGGAGPDPGIPCPDVTSVTVTADGPSEEGVADLLDGGGGSGNGPEWPCAGFVSRPCFKVVPPSPLLNLKPSLTPSQLKKCTDAQAKVANLNQQLHAFNGNELLKTNLKEVGWGAGIGCAAGAVGETVGTAGLGAPFAPGACAVGAVVGGITAEGVFVLSNAGVIWHGESTTVRLLIAKGQAALACHP